jgi:hypothetical protein
VLLVVDASPDQEDDHDEGNPRDPGRALLFVGLLAVGAVAMLMRSRELQRMIRHRMSMGLFVPFGCGIGLVTHKLACL